MADTPFYMKRESDDVLPSNDGWTLPYLKTDIPLEAAVIEPYYYHWEDDTPFYQNDDINDGLPYLLSDISLTSNVIEPYYYHWEVTPFYQGKETNDCFPYLLSDIFLEPPQYDDGPYAAIINNNILQLMLMFNPNTINVKGV